MNTNPSYWCGVLPEPHLVAGISEGGIIKAKEPCRKFMDWFPFMRPSINQKGESCVGWSWAHWYTAMRIRFCGTTEFDQGFYLDGHAIWERGREMFWGGDMSGGLYLFQGARAMADLGIIPRDSTVMRVAQDWDSVGMALMQTPIVQGHAIHPGWFRADPASGCIDHAPVAAGANGYHATVRVARLQQENTRFYVLQNSWGEQWSFAGYGVMSEAEDREGLMTPGLYTLQLPEGWQNDDTWKKYLKAA